MNTESLRIVAIDDEPIALDIVREFCRRLGDIELHTRADAASGMEAVETLRPHVALLDIHLGVADGLALARRLPVETKLIFTTAYAEHALDGFDLEAVDYLHKPFSFERFSTAIERARRRMPDASQSLIVKSEYKRVVVPIAELLYVEARDNYVCLFLMGGRRVMTLSSLSAMLRQLPSDAFVRIHRSFAVARQHVVGYTRQAVFLRGVEAPIPVGRTYADSLVQFPE